MEAAFVQCPMCQHVTPNSGIAQVTCTRCGAEFRHPQASDEQPQTDTAGINSRPPEQPIPAVRLAHRSNAFSALFLVVMLCHFLFFNGDRVAAEGYAFGGIPLFLLHICIAEMARRATKSSWHLLGPVFSLFVLLLAWLIAIVSLPFR